MASLITYNDASFRALFPAYASITCYPQMNILLFWNTATAYINNVNGGCYVGAMTLAQQTLALNYMTAHLLYISDLISQGQNPGIETAATIDKISVTLEPPPAKNTWQYWLQSSPYGQQLLALLQIAGVGGFYIGGVAELSAFRRAGGFVS